MITLSVQHSEACGGGGWCGEGKARTSLSAELERAAGHRIAAGAAAVRRLECQSGPRGAAACGRRDCARVGAGNAHCGCRCTRRVCAGSGMKAIHLTLLRNPCTCLTSVSPEALSMPSCSALPSSSVRPAAAAQPTLAAAARSQSSHPAGCFMAPALCQKACIAWQRGSGAREEGGGGNGAV